MRPCVVSLVPSFCAKQLVANSTVAILGLEQPRMNLPCMTQAKHLNLNPSSHKCSHCLRHHPIHIQDPTHRGWHRRQKGSSMHLRMWQLWATDTTFKIEKRLFMASVASGATASSTPDRKSKNLTPWAILAVLCNFARCKSLACYQIL